MYRTASTPWSMLRRATIGVVVLTVTGFISAHAQLPSSSCSLLQVAEIESALGEKASTKPSGSSQDAGGMVLDACMVEMSGPGKSAIRTVIISITKNLPMDAGDAIRIRNTGTAREPQWKDKGARLEQKNIGTAICIMSGRPNVSGHSVCSIPRGKEYVEVDVSASLADLVSLDVVAALVQKAAARL